MRKKRRTSKGDVSIFNDAGRIRLRWRFNKQRFSLNLPFSFRKPHLELAQSLARRIKTDMLLCCFDSTLERYQYPFTGTIATSNTSTLDSNSTTDNGLPTQLRLQFTAPQPLVCSIPNIPAPQLQNEPPNQNTSAMTIGEVSPQFNFWVKTIKNADPENTSYYYNAKKLLDNWESDKLEDLPELLSKLNVVPTSYNDRLTCIRNFLNWLVSKKLIACNPLTEVQRQRKRRSISDNRRPLNDDNILRFLEAIKNDTFVSKFSRYTHSHYYPFFYFMFNTGVRNAEAIGLRVKHVDLQAKTIEISETFARTKHGTNHASRIRKGTKTENIRFLPLTEELRAVLLPLLEGRALDDFVFTSYEGLSIDDHNLQRRVMKPVMKALGLGEKDLYCSRHSFGTRTINQQMPVTTGSYLMGNTPETMLRNYVHKTRPTTLPTIKKSNNK